MELGWTVIELQAAQQVGRPIDTQKYDGMQLKWQMDNDEQVYVGDSALNLKGLVTGRCACQQRCQNVGNLNTGRNPRKH